MRYGQDCRAPTATSTQLPLPRGWLQAQHRVLPRPKRCTTCFRPTQKQHPVPAPAPIRDVVTCPPAPSRLQYTMLHTMQHTMQHTMLHIMLFTFFF